MESLRIVILLGLAAAASAAACTNSITVDGGRGYFWACLEIGSGCITAHIRYPGISPNPTITFCEGTNNDGSKCHTATLNNICSDIPMLTTLRIPTPDLSSTLEFRAGFRSHPPKVCFSESADECSSGGSSTTPATEEPTPPPEVPASSALLSDADRKAIVDRHNYLRQRVNPSAANMKKMSYDLKLERFSQGYLDRLSDCPLQHNPDNRAYGENVYIRTAWGSNVNNDIDYARIVQLWYDEEPYYNYWFNRCNPPPGISCGHFTQIVWDNTEKVGCATKLCESNGRTKTLVVCNYDPPGNVIPYGESSTRRPYTLGQSCSRCPSTRPQCKDNLCVRSSQAKLQWSNDMMKFLGHSDKNGPSLGAQEWEMGPKETDGERPGELASVSDGDQAAGGGDIVFKVSQEVATEGEGWVDRVI